MTIQGIISRHEEANGHFFKPETKRFFGARILEDTFSTPRGTTLFVTSEKFGRLAPRRYTIREFDPDNPRYLYTVGTFQDYATARQAKAQAKRLAKR